METFFKLFKWGTEDCGRVQYLLLHLNLGKKWLLSEGLKLADSWAAEIMAGITKLFPLDALSLSSHQEAFLTGCPLATRRMCD